MRALQRHTCAVAVEGRTRRAPASSLCLPEAAAGNTPPCPLPTALPVTRRGLILTAAAGAALAPRKAAATAAEPPPPGSRVLTTRCGATLVVPSAWIVASDREPSSSSAEETLFLGGDFGPVDTVSLRRLTAPAEASSWLDGSRPASEVAQWVTASERESVAEGTAVTRIPGVVGATSGTLSFAVLASAQDSRPDGAYFTVETTQAQCRGTITEERGGVKECSGPGGDDLPVVERHALNVFHWCEPYVYVLRVSCAESRWSEVQTDLRRVAATFDASHIKK